MTTEIPNRTRPQFESGKWRMLITLKVARNLRIPYNLHKVS